MDACQFAGVHAGDGRGGRVVGAVGIEAPKRASICAMPDPQPDSALLSALTTEHFVLQSAVNGTIAEASARSTLYVMALSSTLVALGFTAEREDVFSVFAL